MTKINVVDSIMGSGKTTVAIDLINLNPSKSFIYITPYLDEVKRVKEFGKKNKPMVEPHFTKAHNTKLSNLHMLLGNDVNICSTHALFMKADEKTREVLRATKRVLILDEVMDVIQEVPDFDETDLRHLLVSGIIRVEDNYVIWNSEKEEVGRYTDIQTMARNKNLLCVNDRMMMWSFPVDIFDCFEEVYVLTYKFSGQIQKYYYDLHDCEYSLWQVDENHKLVEYTEERDIESRKKLKDLVNIYDGKMNAIGDNHYSLSVNWFKKDEDNSFSNILKNNIYNWFYNTNKNSKNKLWTTFKRSKRLLSGKGYTKNYIPCNTRATNEYRHTDVLAYCCNRFVKSSVKMFFASKSILINENEYALSEMLQWIWRSAIRDGKPINIYIPSSRMRKLLENFLAECD